MNNTPIFLGTRKNNEVVNLYRKISAQEVKQTNKRKTIKLSDLLTLIV